jgi:hypothetical protein
VDEVKIIKSSDSKSFSKLSQTKTLSQTLSGPTGQYLALPEKASNTHREFQPDNVWISQTMSGSPLDFIRILNLGPTARFLREPVEVVLRHFHQHCFKSSPLWFFIGEGLSL